MIPWINAIFLGIALVSSWLAFACDRRDEKARASIQILVATIFLILGLGTKP